MNPIAKYLIAIGLFATYTFGVYQFGVSHKGTQDQLTNASATITQTQQARSTEQALNTDAWKIDAAYQKGLQEGRQRAQTLTDSLLNGSVGMYVPVRPTAPVSSGAATTLQFAKEAQCRLLGQTAADLARLASDANDVARQSNALIDYYEQVLSRVGHPELIQGRNYGSR